MFSELSLFRLNSMRLLAHKLLAALLLVLNGLALQWTSLLWADQPAVHHDLSVTVQPDRHYLQVTDRITMPPGHARSAVRPQQFEFILHRNLKPEAEDAELTLLGEANDGMAKLYRMTLPAGQTSITLHYEGEIHQALEAYGKERARGFRTTSGTISSTGVYLSGGSLWYPVFDSIQAIQFRLSLKLPPEWMSVSQGRFIQQKAQADVRQEVWQSEHPQQEIYLVAAEFQKYQQSAGRAEAQVFLRSSDEALANKYLEATARYLAMYEKLIGPYPYAKFALVENFWETGYGMPSFTLLGPKVIRLPFIITTSYPHEILHNWWGNGVYVDYPSGNWCEGLTAYMADHLFKEVSGRGADYRIQTLQKYVDYAATKRDFPLSQFRSRHSSATESVGYGKSLMFYHMLRQELGDKTFTRALQSFYADNQFKVASYDDIRLAMEQASGRTLGPMFDQWVNRTGAPALKVENAKVERTKDQYKVSFELIQTQDGEAYSLQVPLVITLANDAQALETRVEMKQKQQQYEIEVGAEPLRLDVDPGYDLFRKLDRAEMPPAFTKLFGSQAMLIVVPANAETAMAAAYQRFARDLSQTGPDQVEIVSDDELKQLPTDRAVALLGWQNRFLASAKSAFSQHAIEFSDTSTKVDGNVVERKDNAIAIVTLREQSQQPVAFIAADRADALPGLGRKLPHYHKYSYLSFEGAEPQNRLKGRWPVTQSPMTVLFKPGSARGTLKQRQPLAVPPPLFSSERMMETVSTLASSSMQGRGFGSRELDMAADYIAGAFQEAGLAPLGDEPGSFFQSFSAAGGAKQQRAQLKNVIGLIPANNPRYASESLIIGAHYDHLGLGWPDVRDDNRGKVHHGADDNASGVAILIELARMMSKSLKPERNVIFVAFSGEEAGRLGSLHYVEHARTYPVSDTIGMINLDTVGRLNEGKLLVMGGESATEWVHIFRGVGFVTGIDSTLVKEALDSSDQVSFLQAGVPAVQLFTGANPDYHRPSDTADKIDAGGMLKVATVTKEVIEYLANREDPLTSSLGGRQGDRDQQKSSRKVSLGTIPDFSFTGAGYRLKGVIEGSPAARAGLHEGDVIIRMKEQSIESLRQVSQVLKSSQPGDRLKISFTRGTETRQVEVELQAK
jgi:hypothetical protein